MSTYPTHLLPPILSKFIAEVSEKGYSAKILAQSALALSSLAVQSNADVELPSGSIIPTSLYFMTLAEKGSQQDTCRKLVEGEVERHCIARVRNENAKKEAYDLEVKTWKANYKKLGLKVEKPTRELFFNYHVTDATMPGLIQSLMEDWPSRYYHGDCLHFFYPNGSSYVPELTKNFTTLTSIWGGSSFGELRIHTESGVKRSRWVDGARLAVNFTMKKEAFEHLYAQRHMVFTNTSFLSYFLFANEEESFHTMGAKPCEVFNERILELLKETPNFHRTESHELCCSLDNHVIRLSNEAQQELYRWLSTLSPESSYFSNADALVCRLSAVFHVLSNKDWKTSTITKDVVEKSVELLQWYFDEYNRLFNKKKKTTTVPRVSGYDFLVKALKKKGRTLDRRDFERSVSSNLREDVFDFALEQALSDGAIVLGDNGFMLGDATVSAPKCQEEVVEEVVEKVVQRPTMGIAPPACSQTTYIRPSVAIPPPQVMAMALEKSPKDLTNDQLILWHLDKNTANFPQKKHCEEAYKLFRAADKPSILDSSMTISQSVFFTMGAFLVEYKRYTGQDYNVNIKDMHEKFVEVINFEENYSAQQQKAFNPFCPIAVVGYFFDKEFRNKYQQMKLHYYAFSKNYCGFIRDKLEKETDGTNIRYLLQKLVPVKAYVMPQAKKIDVVELPSAELIKDCLSRPSEQKYMEAYVCFWLAAKEGKELPILTNEQSAKLFVGAFYDEYRSHNGYGVSEENLEAVYNSAMEVVLFAENRAKEEGVTFNNLSVCWLPRFYIRKKWKDYNRNRHRSYLLKEQYIGGDYSLPIPCDFNPQ